MVSVYQAYDIILRVRAQKLLRELITTHTNYVMLEFTEAFPFSILATGAFH